MHFSPNEVLSASRVLREIGEAWLFVIEVILHVMVEGFIQAEMVQDYGDIL